MPNLENRHETKATYLKNRFCRQGKSRLLALRNAIWQ
jgi:hypothetical protein